jgi:hypothetical protein
VQEGEHGRPPGLDQLGQGVHLGHAGGGAPGVEVEQPGPDGVPVGAGRGAAEKVAQLLLGDPGGQQITGRVDVHAGFPHGGESLVRRAFPGA